MARAPGPSAPELARWAATLLRPQALRRGAPRRPAARPAAPPPASAPGGRAGPATPVTPVTRACRPAPRSPASLTQHERRGQHRPRPEPVACGCLPCPGSGGRCHGPAAAAVAARWTHSHCGWLAAAARCLHAAAPAAARAAACLPAQAPPRRPLTGPPAPLAARDWATCPPVIPSRREAPPPSHPGASAGSQARVQRRRRALACLRGRPSAPLSPAPPWSFARADRAVSALLGFSRPRSGEGRSSSS